MLIVCSLCCRLDVVAETEEVALLVLGLVSHRSTLPIVDIVQVSEDVECVGMHNRMDYSSDLVKDSCTPELHSEPCCTPFISLVTRSRRFPQKRVV